MVCPATLSSREFCQLSVPTDWNVRPAEISQETLDKMQSVYKNVEDIDPSEEEWLRSQCLEELLAPHMLGSTASSLRTSYRGTDKQQHGGVRGGLPTTVYGS